MALTRVLKTASATLSRTWYIDETVTDTTGVPVVTVRRLDGTTVAGPTNATGPVGGAGTGVYTYVLPGGPTSPTSATWQLDDLVVSWVATIGGSVVTLTDHVEVVGGFFFSLAEGRASDSSLVSSTTYPTAALSKARMNTEQECERICRLAFVPRFRRVILDGTGTNEILLPNPLVRSVRSVTMAPWYGQPAIAITGVDLAAVNVDVAGIMRRADGNIWYPGTQNVIVEYEYGLDYPPPDLVDATLIRFRSLLNRKRSGIPDRAERIMSGDTGPTFLLSMPTQEKTGIPDVDSAYVRASEGRLPGLA